MKKTMFLFLLVSSLGYSQKETYNIVNLDINNSNSHYGLMFYNNNDVYFSAPVLDSKNLQRQKDKKHPIFSLFEGRRENDGQITNVKQFKTSRNGDYNSSSAVISRDGKYIYITTNYRKKGNTYKKNQKSFNLFIERGEFVEGKGWTNFKKLPFCNPNYSFGHPALSPDGKTLYFVSNIPSAKGPTDIFKVEILGEDDYSEPENLGVLVNSVRKEMFPFVDKNGVLYFSSDRDNGMGGLDIYKSELGTNHHFEKAKLLPHPINSEYDDFSYTINPFKKEGYFSSRRPSGKGDDDIYYFTITKEINTTLVSSN